MTPIPPSGEQHVIRCGADVAVAVEVGGGLRSYVANGRELLDGYAVDEMATGARGQVLAPWPNRLRDGRYWFDGVEYQVPVSEPSTHNALHGLVRWSSWTVSQHLDDAVTLQHVLHPQKGYPFALRLTVTYALSPEGLTVTTTAQNVGATALPYVVGQHPYLAAPGGLADWRLELRATTYVEVDDRGLPTARTPVEGTTYDFRAARKVGDTQIDVAYTDLDRDGDGRAWARLRDESGRGAQLWVDETYPYLEIFTGDTLPQQERRRQGLGVEPMTGPPNALADDIDVQRLEPGESTTSSWGMSAVEPSD